MRKYRKPHRVKKRKSILKNRFFWLGILILIIFGGVFYLICLHSFFQIKEIKISGNSAFTEATADKQKVLFNEIQKIVNEKINQKVLFFSSKSIFLINLKIIKKEISKKISQIEEVNLNRKFPNSLVLEIKERKPVAVFCPISEGLNCFFINKEGIVFESTERKEEFITLKKEVSEEIYLGKKVINEEQLSKILEVEKKLKEELKILSEEILVVSEEGFIPLESPSFLTGFDVKTSEGWQIYFNLREDLAWQLTKLKAVLEKEIPQEKRKNLEYIDIRFGNFAPYKYRP